MDNLMMPQNRDYSDSSLEMQAIAYKERLNNWAIARLLPDMQRVIVARFRSRSDAEGHMQLLRQLIPDACFVVVFDCQRDEAVI
jgi:hypothetical protein